jgi:hypothetical protein
LTTPLIIYVPGLLPKPRPDQHRDALSRCLLASVRRFDADIAEQIAASEDNFQIVPWTFDFYGRHRELQLDAAAIDELLMQQVALDEDVAIASSWKRRLSLWIYRLGDWLPFLIPHLANERMEVHLRDLLRYVNNERGIAERIRYKLKTPLRQAAAAGRPIMLIGHSMGSVIAWDSLWQMTHRDNDSAVVDLLLTMGSPLGQNYIQKRIKGADRSGATRFPSNIRHWKNLAAVGDMTAIDPYLVNDFGEMMAHGVLQSLEDERIFTWFRLDGVLNVHSEYGYLAHEATARIVCDWWRSVS